MLSSTFEAKISSEFGYGPDSLSAFDCCDFALGRLIYYYFLTTTVEVCLSNMAESTMTSSFNSDCLFGIGLF